MDDPGRGDEAYRFFCRNLGVVHHVLTRLYQLTQEEARQVEQTLCVWFDRQVERPGIDEMPVESQRLTLLVATCRTGLVFALGKLDGRVCEDKKLARVLSKDPDEVADGIERKLKRGRRG